MICNAMPTLTKVDILAYIDGETTAVIQEHIANCAHCQAKVQALTAWQQQVKGQLYRAQCPSSQTLGEYQLGLLAKEEATTIRDHLSSCPHCQAELERLQAYLATE